MTPPLTVPAASRSGQSEGKPTRSAGPPGPEHRKRRGSSPRGAIGWDLAAGPRQVRGRPPGQPRLSEAPGTAAASPEGREIPGWPARRPSGACDARLAHGAPSPPAWHAGIRPPGVRLRPARRVAGPCASRPVPGPAPRAGNEPEVTDLWLAAGHPSGGQQPGGLPQMVTSRGGTRQTPVGGTGGALERVSRLTEHAAAQRCGGDVQRIGGGPGSIGRRVRIGSRVEPDLAGRSPPHRVACDHIASRSAAVNPRAGVACAGSQRCRSLGRVRSGASFPPLNQTGEPEAFTSSGKATE